MSGQDSPDDGRGDGYGRRQYLAAIGATGSVALAGCSGGSDGGGSDGDDGGGGDGSDGGDGAGGDSTTTDSEGSMATASPTDGGEEQVCPSPPFSYSRYGVAYPMTDDADPLVTVEAPDGEGFTATTANRQWSLEFGPPRNRLTVRPERRPDGTVEGYAEQGVQTDLTGEYDVPEGVRVVAGSDPGEVPVSMEVLFPAEEGFVRVRIGLTNTETCPEATEAVQDRIVNTVELA